MGVGDVSLTSHASIGPALVGWRHVGLRALNRLPGYPLGGGRLLRAGIWGLTGSHHRATQIAARMGQVVGGVMVLGGVYLAVFFEPVNGVWVGVVGLFLFSMAKSSYPR